MKKNIFDPKTAKLFFLVLLIFLFLLGFYYFKEILPFTPQYQISSETFGIVSRCKSSENKTLCYEELIARLMYPPYSFSMEDTFKVISLSQKQDSEYRYCHNLSHKLAKQEIHKNPSEWQNVAARCPMNMCAKGCIHGVFQETFKDISLTDQQIESRKKEFIEICRSRASWNPTGAQQASCYHGLGHLFMYITNSEITKALDLCKNLAISEKGIDYSTTCNHGIFMQIFQPSNYEAANSIKKLNLTPQTTKSFCEQFNPQQSAVCWMESWPFQQEKLSQPINLKKFCSQLDKDYVEECFSFMFTIMTFNFDYNTNKLLDYCFSMQDNLMVECSSRVALTILQNDHSMADDALSFCEHTSYFDPNQKCYWLLADRAGYNFHKDSTEHNNLCNKIPAKWKEVCREN